MFLHAFYLGVTEELQSDSWPCTTLLSSTHSPPHPPAHGIFTALGAQPDLMFRPHVQFPTLNRPCGAGPGGKPCAMTLSLAHQSPGWAVVCPEKASCDPKSWKLYPGLLPKAMPEPSSLQRYHTQGSPGIWSSLRTSKLSKKEGLLKINSSCRLILHKKTRLQLWMSWHGQLCRVQKTVV